MKTKDKAKRAAKAAAALGLGKDETRTLKNRGEIRPEAYFGVEIPEEQHPKKYAPGELKAGDSVWYRGERYWVESVPETWSESCFVCIGDHLVRPDRPLTHKRNTFRVHADLLQPAQAAKSAYSKQPSIADLNRQERAQTGQRDIGDEVAAKLRDCGTLEEVFFFVSHMLNIPESELHAKYDKLNPGQRRMVLGNRLRAAVKKGAVKLA